MESSEILRLVNLSYSTDKDESLEISLTLQKGKNVVIFGPEDSGIDLLCPAIAGLIKEYKGDIIFESKSISSLDYIATHDFRKKLGYLQRDYGLISNMTVFENIALPLKYHSSLSSIEIDAVVNEYIKEMNLVHCKNFRPVKLTRSETLKTAFLRSIVLDPDLLLLEHSLEGQCIFNVQTFLNYLKKESFAKAKSIVFVTYTPKLFIDLADRFIMLYKGGIVFDGSLKDFLMADNQYFQQYFELSSGGPMSSK